MYQNKHLNRNSICVGVVSKKIDGKNIDAGPKTWVQKVWKKPEKILKTWVGEKL